MKYTDLIFDFYGTLATICEDEGPLTWEKTALFYSLHGAHYTGSELAAAFEASVKQREEAIRTTQVYRPDVPCEDTFIQLFRDRGIIDHAEVLGLQAAFVFRMISIRDLALYPGVAEALQRLKAKGYRLWLLSNAQAIYTAKELTYLGLPSYFDGIYLSSDLGCRKPDVDFFHKLLTEQHLDPSKCLMIGNDRRSDIGGGTSAGLDTLFLHTDLTPATQAAADPALLPGVAPEGCHHYEYEGSNWHEIGDFLLNL